MLRKHIYDSATYSVRNAVYMALKLDSPPGIVVACPVSRILYELDTKNTEFNLFRTTFITVLNKTDV